MSNAGSLGGNAQKLNTVAASGMTFRNRLINGAMDIWQRGTSFTGNGYGPDRFYLNLSGTCTFSQESSDVPSGARYALKWTTGATNSYGQVRQWIEQANVIPLRGQIVTVSAMVKISSNFTGTLAFELGSSSTGDASSAGYSTITSSQTGTPNSSGYSKITATFTVPTNAVGLYIGIVPTAAQATSGAYALQSLIQLEPGSVATPFEFRPYGAELALCQRYFTLSETTNASSDCAGSSDWYVTNGNAYMTTKSFKVSMRSSPTVTISNFISSNFGSASTNSPSASGFRISATATATGNGYFLYTWTASAEL